MPNNREQNTQSQYSAYIIICFEVDKDANVACDMCYRDRLVKKLEILPSINNFK